MKLAALKDIAAQRWLKVDNMKKVEIIRAIQAAEGNATCFDTGMAAECGQSQCLWRADCK